MISATMRPRALEWLPGADVAGIFFSLPRVHYASTGARRSFLSWRDAQAYERGVAGFKAGSPEPFYETPERAGWRDARRLAAEVVA